MIEIEKREIIDSSKDNTMKYHLTQIIPHINQLDISTAYFDHKGYGKLRHVLVPALNRNTFNMRLMLGSNSLTDKTIAHNEQLEEKSLIASLNDDVLDLETATNIDSLINILYRDNIQVRQSKGSFNHSKCYILGESTAAFIGSSNFTGSGLDGNTELNAGIYNPLAINECKKWFERMWDQSTDIKNKLRDTLKKSKFGVPAKPFEIYMKILFERFKERLKQEKIKGKTYVDLTLFQNDAVQSALQIMSEIEGVIIADSTGLGKTKIGLEVLRRKQYLEDRRILLIAPSSIMKGMWDNILDDINTNVKRITTEKVGRGELSNIDAKKYDLILIDESQHFREPNTSRYKNLIEFLGSNTRKQVILMSATPINNKIMDLYHQLALITLDKSDYFLKTIGIANLERYMKEIDKKEDISKGLEKIEQLLDTVMVRQTRTFVQETYKEDKIQGRTIKFPKHHFDTIKYSISDKYDNIFSDILEHIEDLTLAPYSLRYYDMSLSPEEREEFKDRGNLQKYHMLKMFDSSITAGKYSIENRLKLYKYFKKTIQNNKIPNIDEFRKALQKWNHLSFEDDPFEDSKDEFEFLRDIEGIVLDDMPDSYNREQLSKDIDSDINSLNEILEISNKIKTDYKIRSVIKRIINDKTTNNIKKVLIFTEYVITAEYITSVLKDSKEFRDQVIECIHGRTKSDNRLEIIQRFAPKSNYAEDLDKPEIDILVSTEVLAEGQNLQDCNYVLNYDIPWNPMRIVQRTGRVDRITSEHDRIYTRACFPDAELDDIISLMGKVMKKINIVKGTIGLDVEVIGEEPNPKVFGIKDDLEKLAGGDKDVLARLRRESDIMPHMTPLNMIQKYVHDEGVDNMEKVPMSRRSGKKGDKQKIILAFLDERTPRKVYFIDYNYKTDTVKGIDQVQAMNDIKCQPSEELYMPMDINDHHESFKLLKRAYQMGLDHIIQHDDQLVLPDKQTGIDKNVSELRKIVNHLVVDGVIDDERSNYLLEILKSDRVRVHKSSVKDMLNNYNQTKNANDLIKSIETLDKRLIPQDELEKKKLEPTDLKLIGAMFITGDKYKQFNKVDQYS